MIDADDREWLVLLRTMNERCLRHDPNVTTRFTQETICRSLALSFAEYCKVSKEIQLFNYSCIYSIVYPFGFLHLSSPTMLPLFFYYLFSHFPYFQFSWYFPSSYFLYFPYFQFAWYFPITYLSHFPNFQFFWFFPIFFFEVSIPKEMQIILIYFHEECQGGHYILE